MLVALLLLTGGGVLLVAGAEAFAEHAVAAGARLGLHTAALALLLAGAEPEEALVASLAAHAGRPDLAVGDAVGANLVVATLTLGLAGLVVPWPVTTRVRCYAAAAGGAGVLAVLTLLGGGIGRAEGTLLVAAYAVGVAVVWRTSRRVPAVGELAEHAEDAEGPGPGGRGAVPLVLLGVAAMAAGGVLAVAGAERVVEESGLRDGAVGLTLLALATSAEMLALVWAAHRRSLTDLAVAGALGAVAYNATATLGIAALVAPLRLDEAGPLVAVGLVCAAVPLLLAGGVRERVGRVEGAVLVVGWLLVCALLLVPVG